MTTINVKKEMGARVRALRKRKGLTQEDMANRCGLHWTYIGGLERGERNPTLTTLHRVAGAWACPSAI
jgi:transcriptional regulator with XRE-family HTH domain